MKFDTSKHKHSWRVQKGCHVEWTSGSRKYQGTVKRVISEPGNWAPYQVEVELAGGSIMTADVDKIRILKTQSAIRKEQYRN